MRIAAKPTEQEIIEGPQAVSFQIANGNVRQSCILQTEFRPRRWPRNIFSQTGLSSKRWRATRSRRETLKTARSNSSWPEQVIMNASFGLQDQSC